MSTLLRIAYDGTDYHGYATQAPESKLRTIQNTLEAALARFYKQPVPTRGASRTDAGVHARGQLVAFDPPFPVPMKGIVLGLASLLPADIRVVAAWQQTNPNGEPVKPRFGNNGKHYRYRVCTSTLTDPVTRRTQWNLGRPLDVPAITQALAHLIGEHDFASFRTSQCQAKSTIRTITQAEIVPGPAPLAWPDDPDPIWQVGQVFDFHIRGTAFLHKMVRILVGTLIEVGFGRRTPASIPSLFIDPDRTRAGLTAPPHGLTLMEVLWPKPGEACLRKR
ncbi:MAG: tRNA pseudouridine(38-40) synthase TruA [Nannocystaceae bacterium]